MKAISVLVMVATGLMAVSARPTKLRKRQSGCYNGSVFTSGSTPIQIDISFLELNTDDDASGSFTDADAQEFAPEGSSFLSMSESTDTGEEAVYDVYEGGEEVGYVTFEQSQQIPYTNALGDLFDSMIQECIEEAADGEIDTGDQGSSISSMQFAANFRDSSQSNGSGGQPPLINVISTKLHKIL